MNTSRWQDRLIPVSEWETHHPGEWPTHGSLRHMIFHIETSGAAEFIREVNVGRRKRLLVDEAALKRFIERGGVAEAPPPAPVKAKRK